MRRIVWTAWAVVFGLLLALIVVTKFTKLDHPIVLGWTIVLVVGLVACIKAAREPARRRDLERLVGEIEAGPLER